MVAITWDPWTMGGGGRARCTRAVIGVRQFVLVAHCQSMKCACQLCLTRIEKEEREHSYYREHIDYFKITNTSTRSEINLTPSLPHRQNTFGQRVKATISSRTDNHTNTTLVSREPTHAANAHLSHSAGRVFIRFFQSSANLRELLGAKR